MATTHKLDGNTFTVGEYPKNLSTEEAISAVREEYGLDVNLAGWEISAKRWYVGGTVATEYIFTRKIPHISP